MVLVGTTNEIAVIVKCHGPSYKKNAAFMCACTHVHTHNSKKVGRPAAPCATALNNKAGVIISNACSVLLLCIQTQLNLSPGFVTYLHFLNSLHLK